MIDRIRPTVLLALAVLVIAPVGALADDDDPGRGNADIIAVDDQGVLYFIDRMSGANAAVGKVGVAKGPGPKAPTLTDLALDAASGTVYGCSYDHLYVIDVRSPGNSRCVGKLGTDRMVALTVAPDGAVLGATQTGELHRIDPATGGSKRIGTFGNGLGASGDLEVHGGIVYATSKGTAGGDVLHRVDPTTGKASEAGVLKLADGTPAGRIWGLASVGGKLYALGSDGRLFEVDPKTATAKRVAATGVSFWGGSPYWLSF